MNDEYDTNECVFCHYISDYVVHDGICLNCLKERLGLVVMREHPDWSFPEVWEKVDRLWEKLTN